MSITYERFLAEHYHELFGLICEAATAGRKTGELSIWMTEAGRTLKRRLKAMHEDLSPAVDVPQGPHVTKPERKVGV